MIVYLKDKETNEVLREFKDVISFDETYVLFSQNGNLGKIYACDNEYVTDKHEDEPDEQRD